MSDEAILESDTEDYEAYDEDYSEAGLFGNLGNIAGSLLPFPFRLPTRPAPGPAQVARPTTYVPPAPSPSPFVTQAAFSSAMSKIARDVRKNSSAIATVNKRVGSVEVINGQQTRELAKQSKTNARQEKEIAGVRKDLKKTNDNALLMTLLTRPKTLSPTTEANANVGGAPVPVGTKLQFTTGNDNSLLLALMLTGGFGGSGGGDDNNMLFLALALSGGL
jgi:hypothetical protein